MSDLGIEMLGTPLDRVAMAVLKRAPQPLESDDVGIPCRVREQGIAVAADENREMIGSGRIDVGAAQVVMVAAPVDCLAVEQLPDDGNSLGERFLADDCRVEFDACLGVLVRRVPCSDAQLEPPTRHAVDGRGLPGELHRIAHVGVEDERADVNG